MPQRTASAPSAPASNAAAAKQPLSLAAVAAAPGDRATESSPHADDSYCALCRRCQMRKKLERRLAAKKEDVESTHATPTPDRDRDQDHSPSTRHDTRSIDELLSYIGDTPGNAISSSTKSAKRARRKRAAATKRRLGTATAQSAAPEKQPSTSSTYGSDSPVSEDVDFAALHVHDDNAHSRTSHPQKGQPEAEHALSSTSRLSEDDEYDDADEEESVLPTACASTCVEMSREQEEAIDREVEEFRRRLESAHCHSHGSNSAAVLHAHAHRPIQHVHAAQPLPKGRRTR